MTILDRSEIFPNGFIDIFPLVLIWSVITLYFFDLADILRKSPYLLIHLCMIVANTLDIGNLQLKIDHFKGYDLSSKQMRHNEPDYLNELDKNEDFSGYEMTADYFPRSVVLETDPAEPNFAKQYVANDISLYRFLKSIVTLYNIRRNPDKYNKISHMLKIVIDSAGLIS